MTLVMCSLFPVLLLAALTSYQLTRAIETKNNAQSAKQDTEYLVQMTEFVHKLEVYTNCYCESQNEALFKF